MEETCADQQQITVVWVQTASAPNVKTSRIKSKDSEIITQWPNITIAKRLVDDLRQHRLCECYRSMTMTDNQADSEPSIMSVKLTSTVPQWLTVCSAARVLSVVLSQYSGGPRQLSVHQSLCSSHWEVTESERSSALNQPAAGSSPVPPNSIIRSSAIQWHSTIPTCIKGAHIDGV